MVSLCAVYAAVWIPTATVSAATGWYFTFNIVRRATDRHILHAEGSGMASTDWESHLCGALVGVAAAGLYSKCQPNLAEEIDWSSRQVLTVGVVLASALYDR